MRLAKELNGQIEVKIPTGRIDILTDDQIIEVKHWKHYKSAVGQLRLYQQSYPNYKIRIHFFGYYDLKKIDYIKRFLISENIEFSIEPSFFKIIEK